MEVKERPDVAESRQKTARPILGTWKPELWEELMDHARSAFKLTEEEYTSLNYSLAARYTVAAVWLSAMPLTELGKKREALAKLSIILTARRCREIFNHSIEDTLYTRIQPLLHFPQGNPQVVRALSLRLARLSLEDHAKDLEEDRRNRKFNPLAAGLIDFQKMDREIERELQKLPEDVQVAFRKIVPSNNKVFYFGDW